MLGSFLVDVGSFRTDLDRKRTVAGSFAIGVDGIRTEIASISTGVGPIRTEIGSLATEHGPFRTDIGSLTTVIGPIRIDVDAKRTDARSANAPRAADRARWCTPSARSGGWGGNAGRSTRDGGRATVLRRELRSTRCLKMRPPTSVRGADKPGYFSRGGGRRRRKAARLTAPRRPECVQERRSRARLRGE